MVVSRLSLFLVKTTTFENQNHRKEICFFVLLSTHIQTAAYSFNFAWGCGVFGNKEADQSYSKLLWIGASFRPRLIGAGAFREMSFSLPKGRHELGLRPRFIPTAQENRKKSVLSEVSPTNYNENR